MFCTKCGNRVDPGTTTCPFCGNSLTEQPAQPTQQYAQPTQQYAQPTQQYVQAYSAPARAIPNESPALAIWAFILAFLCAPVGLVLGIIGAIKYKVSHKGFCIAAIVVSSVFILLFGLLAAILVPAMVGYVNASRSASYDVIASEVYRTTNVFLIEAENDGYGAKSGKLQEFDVLIADGRWTVSAADASSFENSGKSWGSVGHSDGSGSGGEDAFAGVLASEMPDITSGAFHIVIYDGSCTACAYSPSSKTYLSEDIDYPEVDSYGSFKDATNWRRTRNSSRPVGLFPR